MKATQYAVMRAIIAALAAACLAAFLSPRASAQEAPPQKDSAKPEVLAVEFEPGLPGGAFAPNYSPKGRQFTLAPSQIALPEGVEPLETRLTLGDSKEGHLLLIARSMADQAYDRLWIDANGDGVFSKEELEATIRCEPRLNRGSTWSSFEAKIQVNPLPGSADQRIDFPISLWVVVEDPKARPEIIRISRRGYLLGKTTVDGQTWNIVVSDAHNDGRLGKGDWWELHVGKKGKAGSREIGDFHWGGGRAWKLELSPTDWRQGKLVAHDPGITEEEDVQMRDHLRADRLAPRAKSPVQFRKDADAAIADALAAKKRYFVKFETDWCGPCKTMAELVFTAQEVVDAATGATCIVVDGDARKDLTEKYEVTAYPTGILFDGEGKEIARYVGYQSVKQTAAFLQKGAQN